MQYRPVKGMNDILPDEAERWHRLEATFRRLVDLYGYGEVRTPIVEHTELFVRSIGESTDVVEKEMYTFGHSKESLTLRPEGTAGAARAYVTHKVHAREAVSRWYYLGPMFRAEQPQRGRYRQFFQAGCEVYGDAGPLCDAEMIDMLHRLFAELGIKVEASINSLGGAATRTRHHDRLLEYLRPRASELSSHARERFETNPLRVLDSKDERDIRVAAQAPSILDVLDEADQEHFDELRAALDALGTPYVVDATLVRGLDYYTRTSFELKSSSGELGSQNTLAGGGRYDGMIQSLGGPAIPAIGFAMGLERILLAMPATALAKPARCFLAPLGAGPRREALRLARELRERRILTELDGRGNSLKSMLRRADAQAARLCVVLGDSELARSVVQLKDLESHTQEEIPRNQVVAVIAARLAHGPQPPAPPTAGGQG